MLQSACGEGGNGVGIMEYLDRGIYTVKSGNGIGDMKLDGQVNTADAVALQQYLLTVRTLNTEQAAQADLNGDGRLNAIDLTLLKRMLMF